MKKRRYIVTITKELESFWGMDDLIADYADADRFMTPQAWAEFYAAAIEVLQDDIGAVVEDAKWEVRAVTA
jgi:hypothetical protein